MSMNTLDERLYHYEYRRPRLSNPTYNSSNVFDSLSMFMLADRPSHHMRSYGRYSLPKNQHTMPNNSQMMSSRQPRQMANYSTILPPVNTPRQNDYSNDRTGFNLPKLEDKSLKKSNNTINYDLRSSHLSENAENLQPINYRNNYKGQGYSRDLEEY